MDDFGFEEDSKNMEWSRTDTLPIADHQCSLCYGLGLRGGRLDASQPCNCALRAIFRACYNRFQLCATREKSFSHVTLDGTSPNSRRATWGRKDEEYMADFMIVAKRTLNRAEHQLFRFHYLLGADWRLCCRRLNVEKGQFFHAVYRVEQKLGRIFRELQPYPLYPLDEYFNGVTLEHRALRVPNLRLVTTLRPPVRRPVIDTPDKKAA
jgi:hypothetical protein